MLSSVRKFSKTIIVKILMAMTVVAVVFWGVGDKKVGKHYVATIDKENYIYVKDFIRSKKEFMHSINQNYPSMSLDTIDINKIILDNLIQNKLLEIECLDLGIFVSDDVVVDEIKNSLIFKDKSGNFDKSMFKQILFNNELSEHDYVNKLKKVIAAKNITSMMPKFEPSKHFVNEFYQYTNQKRIVDFVVIKKSGNLNAIKISLEEVRDYYQKNKEFFSAPEYRDIEYIVINPIAFRNQVKLLDVDLEDEISNLQESDKVDQKIDKEQIKKRLIDQKAEQMMYEKIKEIEDDLAAGDSLKEISSKFNLKHTKLDEVTKDGHFANLGSNKKLPIVFNKLLEESFDLDINVASDTIQLEEKATNYYIVNVKNIKPSYIKSLGLVKHEIEKILLKINRESSSKKYAMSIYNKFTENVTDITKLQKIHSDISIKRLALSRPKDTSQNDVSGITSDVMINIFNLKNSNDYTRLFKTKDGDFAFVIVRKITSSKQKMLDQDIQNINMQLSNFLSSMIQQEFIEYVHSCHKIKTYPEILRNL